MLLELARRLRETGQSRHSDGLGPFFFLRLHAYVCLVFFISSLILTNYQARLQPGRNSNSRMLA